jgi:hypothetical protein
LVVRIAADLLFTSHNLAIEDVLGVMLDDGKPA